MPGRDRYLDGLLVARHSDFDGLIPSQLSLTLAELCGVGERVLHTAPDMARNFYTVSARPGHERNLMRPYLASDGGNRIAKGQSRFWIPSCGSGLQLLCLGEVVSP